MKAERAAQVKRQGTAAMALESGPKSGRKVIEAKGISKTYGDKVILRDFDIRILRKDRVALVGPNGVGKTTLLNLLMKREEPDTGTVSTAPALSRLFRPGARRARPRQSLWDNLTGDPDMRVSGRADQIMVRGQPKHVVGYLKDFLFDERQARAPVRALSGGNRRGCCWPS